MHFWIHIEFTKIVSKFKPQKNLQINYSWHDILSVFKTFYIYYLKFIIIYFNALLNKLQNHVFICSIWINFEKENVR